MTIPFMRAYAVANDHINAMRRLRWSMARIAEQVNLPPTASRDDITDEIADRWLACHGVRDQRRERRAA